MDITQTKPVKLQVEKRRGLLPLDKSHNVQRYRAGVVPEYAKGALEESESEIGEESESNEESDEDEAVQVATSLDWLPVGEEDDEEESPRRRRRTTPGDSPITNPSLPNNVAAAKPEAGMEADMDVDGGENEELDHPLFQTDEDMKPDVESSDWESSESESDATQLLRKPPVFKAKADRVALREKEHELELRERALLEELEETEQERKKSSRLLVRRIAQEEKEAEQQRLLAAELGLESVSTHSEAMPDDNIEDDEKAFEEWKIRELGRLKRDWLEERQFELQKADIERRRNMTEEEIKEENALLQKEKEEKSGVTKGKMAYMQKYYHRGAFFQTVVETGQEEAFKKDFNAAVGEDAVDKTLLPKVMQVRRGDFGKRSRSKYTHLADQDTTDRSNPWGRESLSKHKRSAP